MRDRISPRQRSALTGAAVCLPVFLDCCRAEWPQAAAGGAGAALLVSALERLAQRRPPEGAGRTLPGRLALGVLVLNLLALAGGAAARTAEAFPETAGNPAASWLVLGLAVWAAVLGPAVPGRCAGILLPASLILYCIVLAPAALRIRPERLLPGTDPAEALKLAVLLAAPAAGICLHRSTVPAAPRRTWPFWLTAVLAAAVSAVTCGVLSPQAAAEAGSFSVLARSVSVLGVMQRFEALVSGALLMSGFCLCVLLLSAAREVLRFWGERTAAFFPALVALPALLVLANPAEFAVAAGAAAICSGAAACFLQQVGENPKKQKSFEKTKKSVDKSNM